MIAGTIGDRAVSAVIITIIITIKIIPIVDMTAIDIPVTAIADAPRAVVAVG